MKFASKQALAWGKNLPVSSGFTLPEMLVVVIIVGILAAIAIPSWLKLRADQQVTVARDELRSGIQQAQSAAITHNTAWRFSIREANNRIEWAIHANSTDWKTVSHWRTLKSNIVLDTSDTTLAQKEGTYYVRFGFKGDVEYRLGTVTVDSRDGVAQDKCVIVSTLIGATRKGKEHLYPNNNGRYCY